MGGSHEVMQGVAVLRRKNDFVQGVDEVKGTVFCTTALRI
jgi:hypothetical protein